LVNYKTENENRKREKEERPHLDLPGRVAHQQPMVQPSTTLHHQPNTTQQQPEIPLRPKYHEDELVLISSWRMEATSTSWPASLLAGDPSFLDSVTRLVSAPIKTPA
jgi:hypothetical protein